MTSLPGRVPIPDAALLIAIPSRISSEGAPNDLAGRAVVFREDHLDEDLYPVMDRIGFYVPTYMGPGECFVAMRHMPSLDVCQLLTAGFEAASPHVPPGVTLCNAAGVHDASTAELAVGLMIASQRGLDDAVRDALDGRWDHRTRPSLADRRVVVIGAGGVGQAIRRRLEPFEVDAVMVGRSPRPGVVPVSELDVVLPNADIVVLAVPLDEDTRGMVDHRFLARLPDGALVVNVARGPVVDTDALLAELSSGRLRAALDVTDPEPLPPDHPLWSVPGVIITPHVGGDSSAFVPRGRRLVVEQATAWIEGRPLRNVIPVTAQSSSSLQQG